MTCKNDKRQHPKIKFQKKGKTYNLSPWNSNHERKTNEDNQCSAAHTVKQAKICAEGCEGGHLLCGLVYACLVWVSLG